MATERYAPPWSLYRLGLLNSEVPELPEVETVKRGLAPVMEGQVFGKVTLNRADLRFPFDARFKERLEGKTLTKLSRRAKFLQAELSSGDRLFMHLGMSGRFTIDNKPQGCYVRNTGGTAKHDHVVFEMQDAQGNDGARITYNDTRRFGFMELVAPDETYRLDHIGPEPLSNQFNAPDLRARLKDKTSKIKISLLDQRVVAGLGNIYVCEALHRARISPKRAAGRLTVSETETLVGHIKDVLSEAIEAGGSSLRDFANTDGDLGYFQHRFQVYGQEGNPCPDCAAPVQRITQSGRSTFFCGACQR